MSAYDAIVMYIKAGKYSRNQWDSMTLMQHVEMLVRDRQLYSVLRNKYAR